MQGALKTMAGGINLDDGGSASLPEAGIEILQQRVSETQSELDALEDLARRNDIGARHTARPVRFLSSVD